MAGEAAAPVSAPSDASGAEPTTPEVDVQETPPEPKPEPKRWKVGGREVTDPDELYAYAEQSRVERELVERAQTETAQAREFMRMLKEDPRAVLSDPSIGHNLKKLAVDWLKEQMEEDGLTPEQKRIRELERSLKGREEQEKKAKAAAEEQERARAEGSAREFVVKVITDAMAEVRLPKTDAIAKRMASLMLKQTEMGLDLPAVAIARLIEREIEEEHASIYDAMEPAEILRRFPKFADKLRRAHLESLKVAPAAPTTPPQDQEAPRPRLVKKRPSPDEFRQAQAEIMERLKR